MQVCMQISLAINSPPGNWLLTETLPPPPTLQETSWQRPWIRSTKAIATVNYRNLLGISVKSSGGFSLPLDFQFVNAEICLPPKSI
jgi:hypothetical protein